MLHIPSRLGDAHERRCKEVRGDLLVMFITWDHFVGRSFFTNFLLLLLLFSIIIFSLYTFAVIHWSLDPDLLVTIRACCSSLFFLFTLHILFSQHCAKKLFVAFTILSLLFCLYTIVALYIQWPQKKKKNVTFQAQIKMLHTN